MLRSRLRSRLRSADADADADGEGDPDGVGDVVGKAEADTADGVDHLGVGCCLVELAAQVGQVHIHDVAVTDPTRSPDSIKQFLTCAHFSGATAELLEAAHTAAVAGASGAAPYHYAV